MNRVQSHGLCLAVTLTGALCAQNEIRHLDNFGSASRASIAPTVSATLLQRIPADQVHRPSGAGVTGFTAILQCAGSLLPQQFFYELRHNDAAGATTGVPDTAGAATGVAGPFTFPADPGATAYQFIFTFNTPIAVPQVSGVPAGDLYSDVVLPVPAPGDAPLMMQIGFHEPMRASAIGYTGTPGIAGLAWSVVTGLGSPAIVSQNVAWALGTRFSSDVCQPFARRGNNDNFGYAGLFPDTIGGDQPGWRVRATANAG
ncbi:MAG TPA: hypothetical protein VK348_11385, partial [Planctomycetota bacterium]|nr:hypothetical protein [Planctomycetota bacterium]